MKKHQPKKQSRFKQRMKNFFVKPKTINIVFDIIEKTVKVFALFEKITSIIKHFYSNLYYSVHYAIKQNIKVSTYF